MQGRLDYAPLPGQRFPRCAASSRSSRLVLLAVALPLLRRRWARRADDRAVASHPRRKGATIRDYSPTARGPTTRSSRRRDERASPSPSCSDPWRSPAAAPASATPEPSPLSGIVQEPNPVVDRETLPDVSHGSTPFSFRAAPNGLLLVYFGYTQCPDVCPTTMSDVRVALGGLPAAQRRNVQMAMITIDPRRDTPAVLTRYVHAFFPRGLALRTADPKLLADVAKAFGAGLPRHEDEGRRVRRDAHGVRLRRRRPGPPPRPVVVRHPAGHLPEGHPPRCSKDRSRDCTRPAPAAWPALSGTTAGTTVSTSFTSTLDKGASNHVHLEDTASAAVGVATLLILSVAALASFATAATAGAPKVSGVWARTSTEMMGAAYLTIQGNGNRGQARRGCRTEVARRRPPSCTRRSWTAAG